MSDEKLTPATKAVPSKGGIPNGGHATISTPKDNEGNVWSNKKEEKEKIF